MSTFYLKSQKFGQNPIIIVDYNFSYYQDTLKLEEKKKSESAILFCFSEYSDYIPKGTYLFDSLSEVYKKEINYEEQKRSGSIKINPKDMQKGMAVPSKNFNVSVRKFKGKNEVIVIDKVGFWEIPYKENLSLNWNMTGMVDTILNYKVFEASIEFSGRKYLAWFAPEISIQEGPYKFFGLPGLILKISDEKSLFTFEAVKIDVGRKVHNLSSFNKNFVFKSKVYLMNLVKDYQINAGKYLPPELNNIEYIEKTKDRFKNFTFLNMEKY